MWKPFWVTVISAQTNPSGILLAYDAEGCLCICQSLRQVPEIWQPNQVTDRGAHPNDGPMAFHSIKVGYHGLVPNSGHIVEISSNQYKLLHQVGRS